MPHLQAPFPRARHGRPHVPPSAPVLEPPNVRRRELRRRAEEAAGDDFDIREFHDLVLAEGTVPLAVLRGIVERAYDL